MVAFEADLNPSLDGVKDPSGTASSGPSFLAELADAPRVPECNAPLPSAAPPLFSDATFPDAWDVDPFFSPSQLDSWLNPPSVDPTLTFAPIVRTFSSMSVSEDRPLSTSAEPFLSIIEEPLDVAAAEAEAEQEPAEVPQVLSSDSLPNVGEDDDTADDTADDLKDDSAELTPPAPARIERAVRPQRPMSSSRRTTPPRAKYSRPASIKAMALAAAAKGRAPPGSVGDMSLSEFRSLLEGMSNEDQEKLKHRRRQEKNSSSQRRSRDRKLQDAARATANARKDGKRRRAA